MKKTMDDSTFVSQFPIRPSDTNTNNCNDESLVDKTKEQTDKRLPLISDFSALEKLSTSGSTCDTYKWEYSSHIYFVKRLKHKFISSPMHLSAFKKEYELGSRLDHPSIPHYIDFRKTNNECYIVMEFIDGTTLDKFSPDSVLSSRKFAYKALNQLVDALSYLHRNNIVHYDLLPVNIMVFHGLNNFVLIDLDKAFHSAFTGTTGDVSRFNVDHGKENSADADFKALARILEKGIWSHLINTDLNHFYNLCLKADTTAEELRDALAHRYNEVSISISPYCSGDNCECFEGTWKSEPVFVKKLKHEFLNNKYLLDMMEQEFDIMSKNLTLWSASYILLRRTDEDCYLVIERRPGIALPKMISNHHPWLDDWLNIRTLFVTLLCIFIAHWKNKLDYLNYDAGDVFINPGNDCVTLAAIHNFLDTRINEGREHVSIKRIFDIKTGKITEKRTPTSPAETPLRLPFMCRILDKLKEGGIDTDWLSDFYDKCNMGATIHELSTSLDQRMIDENYHFSNLDTLEF